MPDLNVELLLQIADHIEQHAEKFDMGFWCNSENECNTTHCIAGWAEKLTTDTDISVDRSWGEINQRGAELLGLPMPLHSDTQPLFLASHWPASYDGAHRSEYARADDRERQIGTAMVAAELLRDVAKNGYHAVFDSNNEEQER